MRGDSLVRAGHVTPGLIVEAAAAHRGTSRRLVRRAAALVRAEVGSPMESRLRMLVVLAGLPTPVVNHKVLWPDGRVRASARDGGAPVVGRVAPARPEPAG